MLFYVNITPYCVVQENIHTSPQQRAGVDVQK